MEVTLTSAQNLFLQVLGAAIKGQDYIGEIPDAQTLGQVLKLASQQEVLPMICEALYRHPVVRQHNALFSGYRRVAVRNVASQAARGVDFLQLCREAQIEDLTPVVVKGIALRALYPRPNHRPSVDEDLLILPEDAEHWHRFLLSRGLRADKPDLDVKKADEFSYHREDPPTYLELHKYLIPSDSDAYGDLNELFAGVRSRLVPLELGDLAIRTLSPTDHALYLICHALKHVLHSGVGLRQAADLAVFARAHGEAIRWDEVLAGCRAKHIETFAAALLHMGQRYFALERMPACFSEIEVDCLPLVRDSLAGGIYGNTDLDRMHSSKLTLEAAAAPKQGRAQRGIGKSLFPGKAYLQSHYPYARKHPILLPVAWGVRLAHYALGRNRENAVKSLRIGRERVELLRQYKIIP